MRRGLFIAALAGSALAPALSRAATPPPPDVELPASFHGGRPFLDLTMLDGTRVSAQLATAGPGFITKAFADRARLTVTDGRAILPQLREELPPLGGDGTLAVVVTAPNDPLMAHVDLSLGASWFGGRVWTIDYRFEHVTWHVDGRAITSDAVNPAPMSTKLGPYPMLPVIVENDLLRMPLDTAAAAVGHSGNVVATSHVTGAQMALWRSAHPAWSVRNVSFGVDAIDVPEVYVGRPALGSVTFTTRPNDDVFAGLSAPGRLGSNAWAFRILMMDYVRGFAAFD